MGKIIQFPTARIRRRPRLRHVVSFAAFDELNLLERAQLKLMGACAGASVLVLAALQLGVG